MNHILSKKSNMYKKDVSGFSISMFRGNCGGGDCTLVCGTSCRTTCDGGCKLSCTSSCGESCGSGAKWD